MKRAPMARKEGLIIERLDGEVLVFDQLSNAGHALTPVVGRVWEACDGSREVTDLAHLLQLDATTVDAAIDELERASLVEMPAGYSRRELSKKAAKVAVAVPLVYSLHVAGAAAQGTVVCNSKSCSGVGQTKEAAQTAADGVCQSGSPVCARCVGNEGGSGSNKTFDGTCRAT